MRPSELPEFRARMVREMEEANADPQWRSKRLPPAKTTTADLPRGLTLDVAKMELSEVQRELTDVNNQLLTLTYGPADVQRHWQLAELFYVTAEMSALAAQASNTMPGFQLRREDLPAEFGIIFLEDGHFEDDCHVVAVWGPDYTVPGVSFATYAVKPGDIVALHREHIAYGDGELDGPAGFQSWAKIIRCCWLLMQQRIATETIDQPDRASARRLARAGHPVEPVRVISLRRSESHSGGRTDREYIHRWVVRGHWRKQWYPSQDRHIPIWISPHVKGPEGAELLGGEKVYAWTR